jgi:hypothetical protein
MGSTDLIRPKGAPLFWPGNDQIQEHEQGWSTKRTVASVALVTAVQPVRGAALPNQLKYRCKSHLLAVLLRTVGIYFRSTYVVSRPLHRMDLGPIISPEILHTLRENETKSCPQQVPFTMGHWVSDPSAYPVLSRKGIGNIMCGGATRSLSRRPRIKTKDFQKRQHLRTCPQSRGR